MTRRFRTRPLIHRLHKIPNLFRRPGRRQNRVPRRPIPNLRRLLSHQSRSIPSRNRHSHPNRFPSQTRHPDQLPDHFRGPLQVPASALGSLSRDDQLQKLFRVVQ